MLGNKIKSLRKQKGWTTRELAEKSGVSLVTISKGENGKAALTPKVLRKLSKAFGVLFQELYQHSESYKSVQDALIVNRIMKKLQYFHLFSTSEKEAFETILDSFLRRVVLDEIEKNS